MRITNLLFLLLPATASFSQNYHPLIQTGVYRDEYWAPELEFCTYFYGSRFWFKGDTVVDGKMYNKLVHTAIMGAPNAPPFCPPYTVDTNYYSLFALLREDTAARRVYRYDFDAGIEYLLFDFSAGVGDTVTVGYPPETFLVGSESQEPWGDGSGRKRLDINTLNNSGGITSWIESLGAFNDLWDPTSELCICPHGICCLQNDVVLFSYAECAKVVAASEPERVPPAMSVRPNPAGDRVILQLKADGGTFDRIEIFDVHGTRVAGRQLHSGATQSEITVGELPSGLYIVFLWAGDNCVGTDRFHKIR